MYCMKSISPSNDPWVSFMGDLMAVVDPNNWSVSVRTGWPQQLVSWGLTRASVVTGSDQCEWLPDYDHYIVIQNMRYGTWGWSRAGGGMFGHVPRPGPQRITKFTSVPRTLQSLLGVACSSNHDMVDRTWWRITVEGSTGVWPRDTQPFWDLSQCILEFQRILWL